MVESSKGCVAGGVAKALSRAASAPISAIPEQRFGKRPGCKAPRLSEERVADEAFETGSLLSSRVGSEDSDLGGAEIRAIMEFGALLGSQPTTFAGSPPPRTAGAMNPLVQDFNWKSNAYRASHSNLQALREIDRSLSDAYGVSFLRSASHGDCRLLIGSPDFGFLSDASDQEEYNVYPRHNTCSVASGRDKLSPMSCQTRYGF
jgi:hypothetical protein